MPHSLDEDPSLPHHPEIELALLLHRTGQRAREERGGKEPWAEEPEGKSGNC